MLNYPVDRAALLPHLPAGTELDVWRGDVWMSIVAFRFLKARIKGLPVPRFGTFDEVNLRFYVRRKAGDGSWRRGVVFVRELVPHRVVAWVARTFYNENYSAARMKSVLRFDELGHVTDARFDWIWRGSPGFVEVNGCGGPALMAAGSDEEFFAEHYWGYAVQRDGRTKEYRVWHPRWNVAAAKSAALSCDAAGLYGPAFAEALSAAPASAFVADGSDVEVFSGRFL